jgi:hypothetical protein
MKREKVERRVTANPNREKRKRYFWWKKIIYYSIVWIIYDVVTTNLYSIIYLTNWMKQN